MAKLPTKQIYLLLIIVVGLVTLSVYSTYAIFTYESETSEIVSIHTPNSLHISTDSYEYKQVTVPKNSYKTADIDIYNTYNETLCYSVWYKPITKDQSKIKVYQNTKESLETSGTVAAIGSKRINLIITNDSDDNIKVNIGISYSIDTERCELNISKDKLAISSTIDNPKELSASLIETTRHTLETAGYLTYKDIDKKIDLPVDGKIYISKTFTLNDELFTLTNSEEIDVKDVANYKSSDTDKYYTCLTENNCLELYQIIETIETEEKANEQVIKHYHLAKYNLLKGYLAGETGLRKAYNDYAYYGDNPHNFIYYNCINELDNKTCELWRIVGFTYDEKENKYLTKIIKDEPVSKLKYAGNSQTWKNSNIERYLAKEYKLHDTAYLKEITFKQENLPDLNNKLDDIAHLNTENKASLTIMNLSDYLNASVCEEREVANYDETCLKNNWLNKNIYEWTNTLRYLEPYEDEETKELITPSNDTLYSVGPTIKEEKANVELNIRPVVYLSSRVFVLTGDGTLDNPYVIR